MLMNIKCQPITSLDVKLTFDDNSTKHRVIAVGDIVDIDYNFNGLRKHIVGKVLRVTCIGPEPKGWYIIIDGSDDFRSEQSKFNVMSILDCEIIKKAHESKHVETPRDETKVSSIRVVNGELQYSQDGFNWLPLTIAEDNIIKNPTVDEEEIPSDSEQEPEDNETTDTEAGDNIIEE